MFSNTVALVQASASSDMLVSSRVQAEELFLFVLYTLVTVPSWQKMKMLPLKQRAFICDAAMKRLSTATRFHLNESGSSWCTFNFTV